MNLSDFIRRVASQQVDSLRVITGQVTARNDAAKTITVSPPNQPDLLDVRLRAVVTDGTGIIGYPKIGSYVTVAPLDELATEAVVILASELEWFEIYFGPDFRFTLKPDGAVEFRAAKFEFGNSALESAVKGDTLKTLLENTLDAIVALTVSTGTGPSGPPLNAPAFEAIKGQLSTALSTINKLQ